MTLEGTLEATVSSDAVTFEFTVTNTGSTIEDLQFADAARVEFVVEDEKQELWRYTDGRAFAQVISTERIAPGEEATYEAEWTDPPAGEFTAVAELRTREQTCEARASVSVSA